MTYKFAVAGVMVALLAIAPITSASADDWHHHGWGRGGWHGHDGGGLLFGAVAATAALVTLPFAIIADAATPAQPAYYPPQGYYAPPPAAYPAYGYPAYPQPRVVYAYPPGYPQGYVVVR